MRNHDSGTIEEIATRPLIRSHLCHQIRFNNSTRRSNAPTGTAEIKLEKKIINQPTKHNTENSGKEYSPNKFLPVRRNRIALQNATLKEDTSRYQGNANKI
jgi:hypothetical protein